MTRQLQIQKLKKNNSLSDSGIASKQILQHNNIPFPLRQTERCVLCSPTFYPRQMRGKLQLEQVVIAALLTWNSTGINHYRELMGGQAVGKNH